MLCSCGVLWYFRLWDSETYLRIIRCTLCCVILGSLCLIMKVYGSCWKWLSCDVSAFWVVFLQQLQFICDEYRFSVETSVAQVNKVTLPIRYCCFTLATCRNKLLLHHYLLSEIWKISNSLGSWIRALQGKDCLHLLDNGITTLHPLFLWTSSDAIITF